MSLTSVVSTLHAHCIARFASNWEMAKFGTPLVSASFRAAHLSFDPACRNNRSRSLTRVLSRISFLEEKKKRTDGISCAQMRRRLFSVNA